MIQYVRSQIEEFKKPFPSNTSIAFKIYLLIFVIQYCYDMYIRNRHEICVNDLVDHKEKPT